MLVCSIAGTGAASWAGDAGTEDRDTAGGGDGSFTKYIVFDDADSTGRQVELAVLGGIVGVAAMVVGAGSLRKISILVMVKATLAVGQTGNLAQTEQSLVRSH